MAAGDVSFPITDEWAEEIASEMDNDGALIQSMRVREARLEAMAKLATECWNRWESLQAEWKADRTHASWPRDKFESYLDALKTEAEEALK
jgi:hypothetical protein